MRVKEEVVTMKTDASGQPLIAKDGKIECTSLSTVFDTTGSSSTGLIGVYFGIEPRFPKAGMDIKSAELLTPGDLDKDSFDGVSFDLGEIRATTGLVTCGQAGRSVMFHGWKDDPDRSFDVTTIAVFPPGFKSLSPGPRGDFLEAVPTGWKDLFTVFSCGAGRTRLVSGAHTLVYTAAPQPPRPHDEPLRGPPG
ncbi:hypothetical protein [Streptomyces sp. NPDC091217]|uniref:hypothetical protein n=1 Tax=Streptomyces sp. NPDC091217 TaxID=3365975 RepID=UPI00380793FB